MIQPYWRSNNGETTLTIYQGDVLDVLRRLPSESVHCCITSPPYWGLRDYGVDGQIGLEPTPEEYVARMVEVFREVRRVLRPEGTLWLNLGDSYATTQSTAGGYSSKSTLQGYTGEHTKGRAMNRSETPRRLDHGLKPKDLVGIPWRVAFALQADGWYLRSDIIWAKPSPMPESVTDRPTKAHEYIFLLAKNARYYYDADAIREPSDYRSAHGSGTGRPRYSADGMGTAPSGGVDAHPLGRNKRSVWTIATEPFPEAHFATYPTALVEPMILAGASPKACPHCGAPWKRVVEHTPATPGQKPGYTRDCTMRNDGERAGSWTNAVRSFVGWVPACSCPDNDGSGRCVVLDPFLGSGTTLLVAQRLGRSGVGIELNPDYCAMAQRRLEREHAQMRLPVDDGR